MKINIEIDCTPAEARAFLGLADVSAMQERLLAKMEARMEQAVEDMDAEALTRLWVPLAGMDKAGQGMAQGLAEWGNFQKQLWQRMMSAAQSETPESDTEKDT